MTSEELHPTFITNNLHGALQGIVLRSVCKGQLPRKAKNKNQSDLNKITRKAAQVGT